MPQTERPALVVIVDYTCDACGEGVMRPSGIVYDSNPPCYPHRCTKCGDPKTFEVSYPDREIRPAS